MLYFNWNNWNIGILEYFMHYSNSQSYPHTLCLLSPRHYCVCRVLSLLLSHLEEFLDGVVAEEVELVVGGEARTAENLLRRIDLD